jgi:hypothetical protein
MSKSLPTSLSFSSEENGNVGGQDVTFLKRMTMSRGRTFLKKMSMLEGRTFKTPL